MDKWPPDFLCLLSNANIKSYWSFFLSADELTNLPDDQRTGSFDNVESYAGLKTQDLQVFIKFYLESIKEYPGFYNLWPFSFV